MSSTSRTSNAKKIHTHKSGVVASLPGERGPHSFSSVCVSADRRHAIVSDKNSLRVLSVGPSGISEIRNVRISQHFQATASHAPNSNTKAATARAVPPHRVDVRDALGLPKPQQPPAAAAGRTANATITDVAWSLPQTVPKSGISTGAPADVDETGESSKQEVSPDLQSPPQQLKLQPQWKQKQQAGRSEPSIRGGAVFSSPQLHPMHTKNKQRSSDPPFSSNGDDSLVAAAGSNGVVVVWNARHALLGELSDNSKPSDDLLSSIGQPEAVLVEHSRAVHRLAWHPNPQRPGLLLTASQDATVKLWHRQASTRLPTPTPTRDAPLPVKRKGLRSWLAVPSSKDSPMEDTRTTTYSWQCTKTFSPKSEAVRDIRWSPFFHDAFAMVTDSGALIVYDIHISHEPWVKERSAHPGEATTVDWHPTRRYVIATGGGRDRNVKVWDLESIMSLSNNDDHGDSSYNVRLNMNSTKSDISDSAYSHGSNGSNESAVGISTHNRNIIENEATLRTGVGTRGLSASNHHFSATTLASISSSNASSFGPLSRAATGTTSRRAVNLYVLSVSAPVTRLKWRPPTSWSGSRYSFFEKTDEHQSPSHIDRHDSMMAVATSPISGTNAGGSISIGLWSFHRPYMPLSIVDGHSDGAVTNLIWFDTPPLPAATKFRSSGKNVTPVDEDVGRRITSDAVLSGKKDDQLSKIRSTDPNQNKRRGSLSHVPMQSDDPKEDETGEWVDLTRTTGIWQHVLSVGKDGRCLMQSFARGERPISQVPPSTFAMANLSPFQRGYGSLQLMSVHQNVPSGTKHDFLLTSLRRDIGTAQAELGIFRELPPEGETKSTDKNTWIYHPNPGGQREPSQPSELVFSVTDQGDLNDLESPISPSPPIVSIAPEVVHMSRFAESYRWQRNSKFPTRFSLCLHNASVAERLRCGALARMWKLLGTLIKGSSLDGNDTHTTRVTVSSKSALEFVLFPTLKSLLTERANAGDVQTCVVICEIMQVILPPRPPGATIPQRLAPGKRAPEGPVNSTLIPGLNLDLVREWYLSYIDLLQQMCLFSHAAEVIRSCNDSSIGELNQQSTTICESCPSCGKPLMHGDGVHGLTTQRQCKSCRQRIGLCFLCHEPVKGIFVWCPGCGHGGHLHHALEWFTGGSGIDSDSDSGGRGPVQEVCPTGCGHKCNLVQSMRAFPPSISLLQCAPAMF